jgi:EAL domain-containing protein (putative c-di-GMP-specific phosphodiesterase class I)
VDDDIDKTHAELAGFAKPGGKLRQAIERDEFALFCQPILALDPGLSGAERYPMAEILVRMREEEQALLPPGDFLPVFEHYRMMPQLDRWVVRHTVRRLAAGSRIKRFTVNLHGQTLEDGEFPRFVAAQLSLNRVSAEALLFEIDEADTLSRLNAAAGFAAAYHAQGGRVLVDGFGRRSVSFAAIKEVRADFVKVDGAVVRKLLTSEIARTKLGAILRVGQALGYAAVAEFVEEQDVLVRLKAMGVAYAQGFGIYQPHPLDALAG